MKKFFFMAATAALALSSCSSDELVQEQTNPANGDVAVSFDPYVGRTTRATDVLDDANLDTRGFGVFAYEQGTTPFASYFATSLKPNFMYNQDVASTDGGTNWTYAPVKYYSNNPGAKHSFFAYAPFAATAPGTGNYLVLNDVTASPALVLQGLYNGPAIHYAMPEDLTKAVDLCWGDFGGGAAIDVEKPSTSHKFNITFKHALARINFNAQLWVDKVRPDANHADEGNPNKLLAEHTTITIKSVKLIGTMATEGTLRLADGTWDAQVSAARTLDMGAYFDTDGSHPCPYKYVMPVYKETPTEEDYAEKELFGAADNYVMMIPGGSFRIQIVYDVVTEDSDDIQNSSTITNTITSDEIFSVEAGTSTQFHLNLGMTSAKFEATVSAWGTATDKEIDLPANYNYSLVSTTDLTAKVDTDPATNLTSSATSGDYAIDTTDKEYQEYNGSSWTKASSVSGNFYDGSNHKLYIVVNGEVTVKDVATSCSTTDDLKSAATGYYEVGGKVYKVD